jgi:hypothetical protein
VLKGTHFVSIENVKAKTVENLRSLTEHDLQNCFEHWQHLMQLCANSESNYFSGLVVSMLASGTRVRGFKPG